MENRVVKILWIDDVETWASSVQKNLSIIAGKYNVDLKIVPLTNGDEALVLLNIDFDVIVMDYHMEPFRGDHYINEIRFEEHLDGIPIVFYSQDNNTDLGALVASHRNVLTVYRPNLEDKIKELFFER